MVHRSRFTLVVVVALLAILAARPASAQQIITALGLSDSESSEPAEPVEPPRKPGPNDALVVEEQRVADQFKHLEEVLLRMAEVSAANDPRRAALLRQAVAQSKDRLIGVQLEKLITLLNDDQLSRAIEGQQGVDKDLRALLELLMSEDRGRRLESEKARIRDYLKRIDGLLKQQKSLQGRTAEAADPKALGKPQGELAQQTGSLAGELKSHDEAGKTPGDSKASEPKAGEPKPGEPKPGDSKPGDSKPGDSKPGDSKPGDGPMAPPQGGSPQEGTPSETQGDGSQAGQQGSPARQRLEAAQQRMRDAQERLEQAQRDKALEKQEEAIRELEQAKAALEEILRQLREEEIGRTLAQLEARFRKMLQAEREIYDGTVRLGNVPAAEHTHGHDIEAGRLSGKQSEVVLEADKAMALMREDGSAVAFPEALGQMREDMQQVAQRLSQAKVDAMTQSIEKDILAALEEMIESLKKAQKQLEEKRQQPGVQGESDDPPLVDQLAELKMIRALQMRINHRTQRYSELIEGEQATNAELLDALRRLAERQERVFRVTRDLERGQNQ